MGAPALMDAQASRILDLLNAMAAWHHNHVIGGIVSDGGTTQSAGANTPPNIDLDVSQIIDATVKGTRLEVASASDIDADAGDQVAWGAESGKSVVGAVCLRQDKTYVIVMGAVADTNEQVPPTDAECTAFIGDANWCRVANVTFNRTGATTITLSVDHTARPGVTAYPGDLSTTERGTVAVRPRTMPLVQDPPPAE